MPLLSEAAPRITACAAWDLEKPVPRTEEARPSGDLRLSHREENLEVLTRVSLRLVGGRQGLKGGDKEISILGHREIHSPGEGLNN